MKYLSKTEFSKLKDISYEWVHQLIRKGLINTEVVAGRTLILNNNKAKKYRKKGK